jgi:hypothetical protein
MVKEIKYYLLIASLFVVLSTSAQEKWEKPAGGIENAQVVIEKDKVISLRPVSRRFKAIDISVPTVKPMTFQYNFSQITDSLPSLQVIVRPKTMRNTPLEKFYGITAKVGYGNYSSPYILLNAGNKRSDEFMFNTYFNHYSSGKGPVADKFSGQGLTALGLDSKYFLNNVVLSGKLGFTNQSYSMYGYDIAQIEAPGFDQQVHKQKLNQFSVALKMADNDVNNDSDQSLELKANYLSNNHNTSEFLVDVNYDLFWQLAKEWQLDFDANYSLANQNDATGNPLNRNFLRLSPKINYSWSPFTFIAGLEGFYQNDPQDMNEGKLYVYPVLGASYDLATNHSLNITYSGNIERLSLKQLYSENLYLDSTLVVNNNINNISINVGLKGKITERFGYELSYNYLHYKRLMFYDNNALDTARFGLVFDNGGAVNNRIAGNAKFLVNKNLDLSLSAAFNNYTTVDQAEAWHKPRFETDFTTNIYLLDKLRIRLTYFMMEGIKARDSSAQTLTLNTVHDLNIGADLSFTERAGLFLELRNILGGNYQIYNNYPVRGFQVLGGLSYKF